MSEIKNNIEMNIKEDGGSYRALYPINDSFTKVQTLTSLVCDVMGIPETSTPADAFLSLALGLNSYGYYITFLYPDGNPVVNAIVTGVTGINGEQLVTDSNGQVLAVSESQTINVSIAQNQIPYFDIQALSNYSISSVGKVTNSVVNLSQKSIENYLLITSSQTLRFSPLIQSIDITAVGGGGGTVGWSNPQYTNYGALSAGGGGGYVSTQVSYVVSSNETITINVGSGGTNLSPSTGGSYVGGNGGTTTVSKNNVQFLQANGGNGGQGVLDGRGISVNYFVQGGSGNGKGGYAQEADAYTSGSTGNGVAGTGYIFNEAGLGLAGGGGGGGGNVRSDSTQSAQQLSSQGGSPYGANGAKVTSSFQLQVYSPRGIGGGAGGTSGNSNRTGMPGNGASGGVYIRWHNKT